MHGEGVLERPGTMPYPVTVELDRHGGGPERKMLFCYEVGVDGKEITSQPKFQREERGFGGELVNPALGPFENIEELKGLEGIDGGSGGCGCSWRNFR